MDSYSYPLHHSSAIISVINFCCKFYLYLLCFILSVGSSGVGSRVGILSKVFMENNLHLKIFITFSLTLKKDPILLIKYD